MLLRGHRISLLNPLRVVVSGGGGGAVNFQQTDTTATFGVGCSGRSTLGTTLGRDMSVGGTPGTSGVSITGPTGKGVNRRSAMVSFLSPALSPNKTSWAAGNWVCPLEISVASGAAGSLDEVYVCRVDLTGANIATVGSVTNLGIDITSTGVKIPTTISGSSQVASATDRVRVVYVFKTSVPGGMTFSVKPSQLITSPL